MTIKTITCHEVYNHGASLQEFALLFFLNENGHNAEAIHYKPPYLSGHFNLFAVSNPIFNKPIVKQLYILIKLPSRLSKLKRKRKFDEFAKKYIPTDSRLYRSNVELKAKLPIAQAYICGSDQIWNSFFENGKDPAFYLNFVPKDKIKISYAASFATDQIDSGVKQLVKQNVKELNAVSVRETSGLKILTELDITQAQQVLDPIFLIDKKTWYEKFIYPIKEEYIFVYDFDSNPLIKKIAINLKKEKSWKIYTVNENIKYADANFYLDGPIKFLSLIANSKINLTNSFHSVAFSIHFNKEFVIVNRTDEINTRMRDLLDLLAIDKHLISTYEDYKNLNNIDYTFIQNRLNKHIANSKEFLLSNLNENNSKNKG